jgi:hypothetical protein
MKELLLQTAQRTGVIDAEALYCHSRAGGNPE